MKQFSLMVALVIFLSVIPLSLALQSNSTLNNSELNSTIGNMTYDAGQWQLLTGRYILRENITSGRISIFNIPIGVRNNSTAEVNVSMVMQGPLQAHSYFANPSFLLAPHSQVYSNLTVAISEPGSYFGTALVRFARIGLETPAGLGSDIIVYAYDPNYVPKDANGTVSVANETKQVAVEQSPQYPNMQAVLLVALVLVILAALIFGLKRIKK